MSAILSFSSCCLALGWGSPEVATGFACVSLPAGAFARGMIFAAPKEFPFTEAPIRRVCGNLESVTVNLCTARPAVGALFGAVGNPE